MKSGYRTEEYGSSQYDRARSEGFGPEVKRRILEICSDPDIMRILSESMKTKSVNEKALDDVKGMRIGIPKDYFGDGLDAGERKKFTGSESTNLTCLVKMRSLHIMSLMLRQAPIVGVKYGYRTEGRPSRNPVLKVSDRK